MPTSTQIREQRAELLDRAGAINALADEQNRDLTPEEKADFDSIMAEHDGLDGDLQRFEAYEAKAKAIAEARINNRISAGDHSGRAGQPLEQPGTDGAGEIEGDLINRVKVPMKARLMAPTLRNFQGPTAYEEAFISGQWILANLYGNQKATKWCLDNGLSVRDAMTEGNNTKGGLLVPEEFSATLIRLVEQYGIFRQKAYIWPMASDTATIPRRTGGVTVYFVGENEEITDSDMSLDQVTLTARKVAALCKWSTELDEDSAIQIADLLAKEIAYAMAVKEDACGFLGTGAGTTYGGISGLITECAAATATVVTAATGNTQFSTLDLTDFESMIGKLPEFEGINPEWYISKAGWAASMMRLADAAGGNTADVIEGKRQRTFLGYPVNVVQSMNKTLTAQTSTSGLCYFGDLSMACTMGTRRGMTLGVSNDRYFEYDQLAIKATQRFDINVHDVGDTSNAGAVIMLSTPAS